MHIWRCLVMVWALLALGCGKNDGEQSGVTPAVESEIALKEHGESETKTNTPPPNEVQPAQKPETLEPEGAAENAQAEAREKSTDASHEKSTDASKNTSAGRETADTAQKPETVSSTDGESDEKKADAPSTDGAEAQNSAEAPAPAVADAEPVQKVENSTAPTSAAGMPEIGTPFLLKREGLQISSLILARGVEKNEDGKRVPVDEGQSFIRDGRRVLAILEIENPAETEGEPKVSWIKPDSDKEIGIVSVSVKARKSWRTWAFNKYVNKEAGIWQVVVRDVDGTKLAHASFEMKKEKN